MKLESAMVVANKQKEWANELKKEVEKFLTSRGIELTKNGNILITIGGDGTILHERRKTDKPIFGIGSESSHVCQARKEDWKEKLGKLIEDYIIEKRTMLSCWVEGKEIGDALNDVCIRSSTHRVVDLRVKIDGRESEFMGDGLVAATPTGSSAYTYACGGEELSPHEKKLVVVAIAPHRRKFSPITISDSETIEVEILKKSESSADVILDGQRAKQVKVDSYIIIRKSERTQKLVKP